MFHKPEWGQNSHGISVVFDAAQLEEARQTRKGGLVPYLLQEPAREKREFEIFYLRSPENYDEYALLSITETVNSTGDSLPVNGVLNQQTSYREIDFGMSRQEKERIWRMFRDIGKFSIARVGLRAEHLGDVLAGKFHIFEINIFLPMPLILLDSTLSGQRKRVFIRESMRTAALLIKKRDRNLTRYPVFFKHLLAHYQVK